MRIVTLRQLEHHEMTTSLTFLLSLFLSLSLLYLPPKEIRQESVAKRANHEVQRKIGLNKSRSYVGGEKRFDGVDLAVVGRVPGLGKLPLWSWSWSWSLFWSASSSSSSSLPRDLRLEVDRPGFSVIR